MSIKPMTFQEWLDSTGGNVAAETIVRDQAVDDEDEMQRLAAVAADADEDLKEVGRKIFAAYHAYICAFIEADREDRDAS